MWQRSRSKPWASYWSTSAHTNWSHLFCKQKNTQNMANIVVWLHHVYCCVKFQTHTIYSDIHSYPLKSSKHLSLIKFFKMHFFSTSLHISFFFPADEHKVNSNLPLQFQVKQVVERLSRLKKHHCIKRMDRKKEFVWNQTGNKAFRLSYISSEHTSVPTLIRKMRSLLFFTQNKVNITVGGC